MKKLFLKLSLAISSLMLFSTPVFAAPTIPVEQQQVYSSTQKNSVSPRVMYTYSKTVKKTYSSVSEFPESIYYEEYHDVYGICRGTLKFDSSRSVPNGYEVTFKGTMVSNNI